MLVLGRRRTPAARGYVWSGVGGLLTGAALTFWLDPQIGRRRRARTRDQLVRVAHDASEALETARRDFVDRARGTVAEATARLSERAVPDDVLSERVRAALGRVCSHPHAIEVAVHQGHVDLRGPILRREARRVLRQVARVRGVRAVGDAGLELHERPGDVPGLQGRAGFQRRRFELMQTHWAPAPRALAGIGGVLLAGYGLTRRGLVGLGLGAAGLVLAARAATNIELRRLFGVGAGQRAIDLVKEIQVNAPVEEVFAFWRAHENFPRFMRHVQEVRQLPDGRYHWRVEGPAGMSFEWDGEITELHPNRLMAWRSVPGAQVGNAGVVRFEPHERGGTRLNVRLSYNPPAGALGHAFAKLLGLDPKRQMDDDLLRFKSLVEKGKATGHETVTKEQLHVPPPEGFKH